MKVMLVKHLSESLLGLASQLHGWGWSTQCHPVLGDMWLHPESAFINHHQFSDHACRERGTTWSQTLIQPTSAPPPLRGGRPPSFWPVQKAEERDTASHCLPCFPLAMVGLILWAMGLVIGICSCGLAHSSLTVHLEAEIYNPSMAGVDLRFLFFLKISFSHNQVSHCKLPVDLIYLVFFMQYP